MARSDDRKIRCAFCGRTQDQVYKLIAGNGAYICSDCVRLCMNIVDEDLPQRTAPGKRAPIFLMEAVKGAPVSAMRCENVLLRGADSRETEEYRKICHWEA